MSAISLESLSIKFRVYHNSYPSVKEYLSTLISSKDTPKKYSDFWALKNVSINIKNGERVGVIGHNGAGKSTLLKVLCGIYDPTIGNVHIQGRIAPLLEIGAGFHPEFTGRENIYLNGAILGYSKVQLKEIESEVIAFAELEEFIDTPVKYYSTGMYLRLAFSLATAIHPDILILDEMFAGGDAGFVTKASARLKSVIEHSDIMVLVSHELELLEKFCDRVIWMDHGSIKMDGDTQLVLQEYKNNKKQ